MPRLWLTALALPASVSIAGCQWIGNTADNIGQYIPVIDYRCEHWQCVTPSGQATSDAIMADKLCTNTQTPAPKTK